MVNIYALGKILSLENKPNLTETEKKELGKAIELLKEEQERENIRLGLPKDAPIELTRRESQKRENINLGLPEDAPIELTNKVLNEKAMEIKRKNEESKRKLRDMQIKLKEIRKGNKQSKAYGDIRRPKDVKVKSKQEIVQGKLGCDAKKKLGGGGG